MPKVKSWKSDTVPHHQMVMRMVSVRPETVNEQDKTVQVVIASENPVERYDEQRGIVVREVLQMSGVSFRTDRMQLPIVDSHDRSTVRNVLGSVRNVRVEGSELVGDATFARDADSQIAFEKLLDGHLTDFSITATPNEVRFVERGDVVRINGADIEGPAELITNWTPTDASLVAAGADETSTVRAVRRSYQQLERNESMAEIKEELKQALVAKGMPEQLSAPEEALAWAMGVLPDSAIEEEPVEMMDEPEEEEVVEQMDDEDKEVEMARDEDKEEVAKSVGRALKVERTRAREIRALADKANIERAVADKWIDDGLTLEQTREKVLERYMDSGNNKAVGSVPIEVTASSDDKFAAAVGDGLVQRAFQNAGIRRKAVETPAPGADDFRHMGLQRIAERFLQRQGVNTDRMTSRDIALAAMGDPGTCNRHQIRRDAYHVTGSFPQLMLDAANKTLLAGYEEAPYTWSVWCRQAPSVADFKQVHRVRFSESPDLDVVPENKDYPEKAMSDQKESYRVEKYGALFTVTWETVVNDDLDALSRIPAMHGNAARRKQNKVVYQILFDNPTMSDSVALFGSHSSGTNLDASGAAPSVSELNNAFVAMMTQTGLHADTIINVQPRYLIVPAALAATAMQLVGSIADPSNTAASTEDASRPNYNSGTLNIYGPNGTRPLQIITEPLLDGNSATAWYLAADYGQVDTLELAYLQGEESPVLESEWDFKKDCYLYKIRQTFGAAAIDWRGLYKNPGT